MTYPETIYREAFAEFKDAGFSDADADIGAREAAKRRTLESELATKRGFIGDPTRPESNVFDPLAQPNRASGVVLAGTANSIPASYFNPETDRAWSDDEEGQKFYQKLTQDGDKAMSAVRAAPGEVPKADVDALASKIGGNIQRAIDIYKAGGGTEAGNVLYPSLMEADELARQNRFQEKAAEQLSRLEWQQLSDARTRKREAENALSDRRNIVRKSEIENRLKEATAIIQRLEAKAMGVTTATQQTGGLREGQRVRNKKTGQMGTVINGEVVPD